MLYMVVERFKPGSAHEVYRHARERGRLLPDGLLYVSSWVDLDYTTCFQLMETEDETLFQQWIKYWDDLVEFEIVPVRTSAEAIELAPRISRISGGDGR
jgi:Protein of unknown function (DUF3303)